MQVNQIQSENKPLASSSNMNFFYGCESWTLIPSLENRIAAFEMRCFRRLLNIPYTAHMTNIAVREEVEYYIGKYESLLKIVRRRKVHWFGHVSRQEP